MRYIWSGLQKPSNFQVNFESITNLKKIPHYTFCFEKYFKTSISPLIVA